LFENYNIKEKCFNLNFSFLKILLFCFLLFTSTYKAQTQNKSKLDSLQKELAEVEVDSTKILLEIKISRELQRKKSTNGEAFRIAECAVDHALSYTDTLLYARALDNLGLLYRFEQNYKEALPLHTRAFELVEEKKVPNIYKMIFADNAGLAARYDQNYDLAISFYMKALKLAEEENNLKNIAIASNGIGNSLGQIPERKDEAIEFFKRSLAAEKKLNNSLGVAMNYLSISAYYIDKKDFYIARKYLDRLLEINKERNDKFGLAITYEHFGIAYLEEGKDLEKAKFYFENALGRFTSLNNKHKQAEIISNIGNTELKKHNLEKAEKYYKQAIDLAFELERFDLIEINSSALSDLMENKNDYKKALYYFKQSEAYKDSINLGEQNLTIESLIRKYDISEKENYIELLEKDKVLNQSLLKNQEEQLKRRRLYTVFLSIGLVLLIIIFILQYRNYIAKKRSQSRILKEEKEKLNAVYERNLARAETIANRLRINPHFLFNSLNAITYLVQSNQNQEAISYLRVFSRYTRMLLETSTKQVIPIEEELELAKYYMILEENRFEKDFEFKIEGEDLPELDLIEIPPLLLQPFLENAVWHGLLPQEDKPRLLKIIINQIEEGIQIIIDDNGVGRSLETQKNKKHKSMGIKITNERIDLFNKSYHEKINYEIVDKLDKKGKSAGTKVVINIEFAANDEKKEVDFL